MIFLYEFVSGGGGYSLRGAPRPGGSLLVEGQLMARAVAEDLSRLPGVEVVTLQDARLDACHDAGPRPGCCSRSVGSREEEEREFKRLAAAATGTLVIAPETGGALLQRVRWALEAGGRLLGPDPALVELASDKHRLAEHLFGAGIRAPQGVVISAGKSLPAAFRYPAVLKPLDGAGSLDTRLVPAWIASERGLEGAARLEVFYPGIAASVAVLCGPGVRVALPACAQKLNADFCFLGASTPLAAPLAARAEALALSVIGALDTIGPHGGPRGYLGVDLVLGPDSSGTQDVAIEVNPRLTTSYVALRQSLDQNLMEAMLRALQGESVRLCGVGRAVQFDMPRVSHER